MADSPEYRYMHSAEFYDGFQTYRERADIAFYVEEAIRRKGPILEVGCGTGRVLIPTAKAGLQIVGVDLSAQMLAQCRENLAAEADDVQSRVTLVNVDMRDFSLDRQFSLITIPFRPFQHLEEVGDQLACLRCVHSHLGPEGRFVFDLFNPWLEHLVDPAKLEPAPDGGPFFLSDGRRVQRYCRIVSQDFFRQVRYCELSYHVTYPDGREETVADQFPMRYTFRYEMEHLLVRAGFEVEDVFSGFDRSPYGASYPGELIFVARRQ